MTFEPNDAKSLFLAVSELPAGERILFLDRACAGKPELRARVEALLSSLDDAGSFLARPIVDELEVTHCHPGSSASSNAAAASDDDDLSFLEPCETPGRIGKLGAYEIIEVIGRGGMGMVLKAYDTKLNRIVAVKVLMTQAAASSMAVKRFLREAQAAAAVSHDHVVTIFAVEAHSERPYLVMECIVGQSLQQKIDRHSPLTLTETLRIGMQIASGLAAAHKQGLVHRDIKPLNILLENGVERVKITDFGLARAVDDVGMTQTGHIAGTPQYMSPEQAMGERVDSRSDLFSLGSVLYSMCTGRPAFRADSTVAVLRRVCDDTPRPIREINVEVPEWLVAIISKLMNKKPQDRFQTAAEVADLLSQCLAWSQHPDGPRPAAIPPIEQPRSRSSRGILTYGCGIAAILFVAWALLLPTFRLLVTGRAQIDFQVNDGDTVIDLIRNDGERVARKFGPGKIELPEGVYRLQVSERPHAEVWNVFIQHWDPWMWKTETRLSSPPWGLQVNRGDQFRIFVSFAESPAKRSSGDNGIPAVPSEFPPTQIPLSNDSISPQFDTSRLQLMSTPFTAAEALKQQEEWAQHLGIPIEYTSPLGACFRLITPGRFTMGNSYDEVAFLLADLEKRGADEYTKFSVRSSAPQHRVQLESPYYIAEHETTVAQFQKFVEETNYVSTLETIDPPRFHWKKFLTNDDPDQQPVCGVSWDDAKAFCDWLSKREKCHYDLPTEAQWEYACRAGNEGRWCFGNDATLLENYSVHAQLQSPTPIAIGTRKPNAFGLYDMHGNVEEWCLDWHVAEFYKTAPMVNPVANGVPNDPSSGRVTRGGSWQMEGWQTRSAMRRYDFPTIPMIARGFRVVITGDLILVREDQETEN